jgi:bifunctional DNA-binding transcriptional regulator/antitoxin component of YhaV-PrlF toxin-antitoxin module
MSGFGPGCTLRSDTAGGQHGLRRLKVRSLTLSLIECHDRHVTKVTGKFQITLPKALVDHYGIQVGDELDLRPVGRSIQIDRRITPKVSELQERLAQFDQATLRQRTRQRTASRARSRSRGWTREELYVRGRAR